MLEVYITLILAHKRTAYDEAFGKQKTIPEQFRADALEILNAQGFDGNGIPLPIVKEEE